MKNWSVYIALFLFLGLGSCKDDPNPKGDYINNFFYENILNIPINDEFKISSVEPARVHPGYETSTALITKSIRSHERQEQNLDNAAGLAALPETFPPSLVLVKGSGFDKNVSNHTITIGDIKIDAFTDFNSITNLFESVEYKPILDKYDMEKDILFKVPYGVETGLLTIKRPGGECTSFDKKSGYLCSATEIYLDCYSAYKNRFGEETIINYNSTVQVEYEGLGIKAFKSNIEENLFTGTKNVLNISCSTIFSLKRFDKYCTPKDEIIDGKDLIYKPISIEIEAEPQKKWTMQYLITSGKGHCKINLGSTSIY